MCKYKQEQISEISKQILNAGYRVFIADSGTYGFFTDKNGSRVVSFQTDLLSVPVSGNYVTDNMLSTGTGWRIADNFNKNHIDKYFKAQPPMWAIKNASKVHLTTLKEHLNTYQKSSKYHEL